MATGYTREWIRFFTGCGIPDDVATVYALIFYENRIQKNMLPDLNKEYLRDMGITVMGDVIAILRHAKIVHEKYVREQILSVDDSILDDNNFLKDSSPGSKKSTPMKRMLEHYTRKYNSELEPGSEVQVILPNEKRTPPTVSKKLENRVGLIMPQKKKIQISVKENQTKVKGLEVPVPKVRRVLPENEGGYKIKMPTGSTERSKKLLEQAKKRKIKTVFERLGESSVSSTTSDVSTGNSLSSSASISVANKEKNSSVFARLGEKTGIVSSTSIDDVDYVPTDQLQYAGILKGGGGGGGGGGLGKKNLPNTTMRADDEQQKTEVSKLSSRKGISVKRRLGMKNQEVESSLTKKVQLKNRLSSYDEEKKQIKGGKTIVKVNSKAVKSLEAGGKAVPSSLGFLSTKFTKVVDSSSTAQGKVSAVVSTTTAVERVEARNLKRKLDATATNEGNPSKKVRFGKTTHRLIPSTTTAREPTSNVNNYPKLTMIISNRSRGTTLSSGIRIGSLNSDKMRQKMSMKERIGQKGTALLGGRLGKKATNVHDRLG